jgi:hypothetical protein
MDENEQEYLIPRNVSTRFMFIPGFGWRELFIGLIGLGIGLILFFIVSIFTESMLRIFLVFIPTIAAIMLTISDPKTGVSLMQLLKDLKEFNMSVRKYYYRFGSGVKKDVGNAQK